MRPAPSTSWPSEVQGWVRDALTAAGRRSTGPLREVETRPWSTVWTMPTDHGAVWFKEVEPTSRQEPAVHAVLAGLAPDLVDRPLAVEPERGWLLSVDGGATLAAAGPAAHRGVEEASLPQWLADYTQLQRLSLPGAEALRTAGLVTVEPAAAATTAAGQARQLGSYGRDDPRHLSHEQVQAVLDAGPALAEAAEVLAAGPVPLTLDHADLFPRNVFLPCRPGSPYRFFDFAESVWGHPFGSLVMLLPELQHRWQVDRAPGSVDCRDPRIRGVLDAYLGCWRDLAPLEELRELAAAALRLAPLQRSTPWLRTLTDADAETLARHGRTPWAWLQDVTLPVLL